MTERKQAIDTAAARVRDAGHLLDEARGLLASIRPTSIKLARLAHRVSTIRNDCQDAAGDIRRSV